MEPVVFYPDKANLTKGLVFGVVLFAMGQGVGDVVGTLFIVAGLAIAGICGYAMARPAPCFEADADGFSVMGKAKRPWSEYRGSGVYVVRYWFVPVGRWAYVQAGKRAITSRKLYIRWTHLPFPPKETALRIEAVAHLAREAELTAVFRAAPSAEQTPPPQATTAAGFALRDRPAPAPASDGGPIRSSRGLFGRSRKVM